MTFEIYQASEPDPSVKFTDTVEADDIMDAAEKYAESIHSGGDPFDTIDLIVVDPDGKSWIVSVAAIYSVDFSATVPR